MKLFLMLVMLTLPIVGSTFGFTVKEPPTSNTWASALIEQKAQASGVGFVSNNQQYKLILGGLAVKENTGNSVGLSLGHSSSLTSVTMPREAFEDAGTALWQGEKGAFKLFINDNRAAVLDASVDNTDRDYYQIAYNSKTKAIAIICGNIIVTYDDTFSTEMITQTFSIQLVDHFPDMNVAIFSVPSWVDIFATTDQINQSGMVVAAEIEVLENAAVPL
ncbi:MAG: hypothetical protein KC426_07065 [Oceanospirillaceae bacterium]|nr:hypothetical protein [Oceanospirillaceae bacterium]